ncbi:MAG TPA: hypothetical protein VGY56_07375 [Verrucomicrobiae bacterium]|nr:hypothetical protein [Verrucomicrobiae bacterium]
MPDNLGDFLAGHDWELFKALKGWQVERDDKATDVIRLTLPARDGEQYIVRFVCDGYPDEAPRVQFINAQGSASDRTAWPNGNGAFCEVVKLPPHSFLCTDLTREGFEHHADWKSRPTAWKGTTHTLLDLFNYIQDDLLNSVNYQGRAK